MQAEFSERYDCIMVYQDLSRAKLIELQKQLSAEYDEYKKAGLKLDMSRGRPGKEQLDIALDMLTDTSYVAESGMDCRNYGNLEGLPELREILSGILNVPASNILVGENASLSLMYFCVMTAMVFGVGGCKPWSQCEKVKFLCPVPGYDRHFAITEEFGIEMINIAMDSTGPDMDTIERLVASDDSIKGIWCVPKYSNPSGVTYSDETVRRFAALKPAAKDFRIFWDNAYCVHHLYPDSPDKLLDLYAECVKCGSQDMPYIFFSTSKITFAGGGVSAVGSSAANIAELRRRMSVRTIGADKLNQLRHVDFIKSHGGIDAIMRKHAAILRPKFEAVLDILESELSGTGSASWTRPAGGYFISFETLPGCAKKVVSMCRDVGVTLTSAGATYPYGRDPRDSNIRIAPSAPSAEDLKSAAKLLCLCTKLAAVEALLAAGDNA